MRAEYWVPQEQTQGYYAPVYYPPLGGWSEYRPQEHVEQPMPFPVFDQRTEGNGASSFAYQS